MSWDIRSIYELPSPEPFNTEVFFTAFEAPHKLNAKTIRCIMTAPKYSRYIQTPDGIIRLEAILLVRTEDISGAKPGAQLRVDGRLYQVMGASHPVESVTRLELGGYDG